MPLPLPPDLDVPPTTDELQSWENRSLNLLTDNVETILIDNTMREYIALACNHLPRCTRRLKNLEAFLKMVDAICIQGYIDADDAKKIAVESHLLIHGVPEAETLPPPPAPEAPRMDGDIPPPPKDLLQYAEDYRDFHFIPGNTYNPDVVRKVQFAEALLKAMRIVDLMAKDYMPGELDSTLCWHIQQEAKKTISDIRSTPVL